MAPASQLGDRGLLFLDALPRPMCPISLPAFRRGSQVLISCAGWGSLSHRYMFCFLSACTHRRAAEESRVISEINRERDAQWEVYSSSQRPHAVTAEPTTSREKSSPHQPREIIASNSLHHNAVKWVRACISPMMRPRPASSMQKTYDECYLLCSTAVYFEGQVGLQALPRSGSTRSRA